MPAGVQTQWSQITCLKRVWLSEFYSKMSWFYKCWQVSEAMQSDTSLGPRDAAEGPAVCAFWVQSLLFVGIGWMQYTWGPTGSLGKAQWCSGWEAAGWRSSNKAHFQMEKIQMLPLYSHSCTTRGKEVPKEENQEGGRSGRGRGEKERKRCDSGSPGWIPFSWSVGEGDLLSIRQAKLNSALALTDLEMESSFQWNTVALDFSFWQTHYHYEGKILPIVSNVHSLFSAPAGIWSLLGYCTSCPPSPKRRR